VNNEDDQNGTTNLGDVNDIEQVESKIEKL
jgi:hypothetical protein